MDAKRLDVRPPLRPGEIAVNVEELLISSTAFRTLIQHPDPRARLMAIVSAEGRFRDPETGAGGVLRGRITAVSSERAFGAQAAVGQSIVTLLSLAGTPLLLTEILDIDVSRLAVRVRGTAYLPDGAPWIESPADLPDAVSVAALDVCGAPAQAHRLAHRDDLVLVLGAGKAGVLTALAACEGGARVLILDQRRERIDAVRAVIPVAAAEVADATNPLEVYELAMRHTDGRGAHLTFSCVNVARAESAAFLSTRQRGTVVYFSMSTDFARAALGAESVCRDVDLLIGNGFVPGHAEYTLDLVRRHPEVHALIAST